MNAVVIDTSALIRLYIPDGPLPDGLEDCVQSAAQGDLTLLAPELIMAEAGQVLRKKEKAKLIATADVDEILEAIVELPLDLVSHRSLVGHSLHFARQYDLTVYDALFCVLASERGANLITADDRVSRAFVKHYRVKPR